MMKNMMLAAGMMLASIGAAEATPYTDAPKAVVLKACRSVYGWKGAHDCYAKWTRGQPVCVAGEGGCDGKDVPEYLKSHPWREKGWASEVSKEALGVRGWTRSDEAMATERLADEVESLKLELRAQEAARVRERMFDGQCGSGPCGYGWLLERE